MGILVPLLLLLSPVCGLALELNWKAAQTFCRTYHTDLVTIRNETENQYLFKGEGWIGLSRKNQSHIWSWSMGNETANFSSWATGEPRPGGRCVFKHSNTLKWMTARCNTVRSFMCYDERLILVRENKTWEEALNHCRSLERVNPNNPNNTYRNHRYDLATLITEEDHAYAQEITHLATTFTVWTGLRFLAGQWVWVGGERVQYKDIRSCPTTKYCGVLEKNSTASFAIRDCDRRRNFLCYKRL